jgi:3-oxoacyl-[acyl-carrier protein] reductase
VGLSICRAFLEKGHTVYGISRSYSEEFQLLQNEFSGKLLFKSVDLNNNQEVIKSVFKDYIDNSIPLDCFINNAAAAYDDIITNLNISKLEDMYRTNVFSPMLLVKYTIRNMIFNRVKGNIIHISSVSAHTGYKGLAMYASSKGALEAFSKNTAREWGEYGIRSNVIVPGFMDTDMSSDLSEKQKSRIYQRTSLKMATNIESVAKTAVFVASSDAESITGQNIHVDSGTI